MASGGTLASDEAGWIDAGLLRSTAGCGLGGPIAGLGDFGLGPSSARMMGAQNVSSERCFGAAREPLIAYAVLLSSVLELPGAGSGSLRSRYNADVSRSMGRGPAAEHAIIAYGCRD